MNEEEIKSCLREFAQCGYFQISMHCRKRMEERCINTDDVLNVLLWGDVSKIEYEAERDNWTCKVAGTDIEGEPLVFVAGVFQDCYTVRCITVY
jgi:hypothetical protein